MSLATLFALAASGTFKHLVFHLGGPGLIVVALVDNSFIPVPGSLDVFTILLSSGRKDLWWYYATMATVGSVIGAYLTYRIGEKGGEEVLERRIGKARAGKVYKKFEKAGFMTLLVGVLIPPPFPAVPVLLAAGIMKYPPKKFATAVALGRGIRFTVDALLGVFFGRAILGFFSQYYKPALYTLIALAVVGGIATIIYLKRRKRSKQLQGAPSQPRENAA